jgi:hypothetical protein
MRDSAEAKRDRYRRAGVFVGLALVCSSISRAVSVPVLEWGLLAVGLVPLGIGISLYVSALRMPRSEDQRGGNG